MASKTMLCPTCWGNTAKKCQACGESGVVPNEQLSEHFWLSDVLRSQTAARLGLPNMPTGDEIKHMRATLDRLAEPIYAKHPFKINSGIRCLPLNRALKSSDSSAHVHGYGLDMDPIRVKRSTFMNWIVSSGLKFDQVIYEGTWIHIGLYWPINRTQRGQKLMIFGGGCSLYNPNDPRVV